MLGSKDEEQENNSPAANDIACYEKLIVKANEPLSQKEKNKMKKKNYNRRKKQKLREKKESALKMLETIIHEIYRLETNFKKRETDINACLEADSNEDRFYTFINYVIRDQVDSLSSQIHLRTSQICRVYEEEKVMPPNLTAELYEKIQTIVQASPEVEKIINFFIFKRESDKGRYHHNLDLSTLKFVFESDPCKNQFQALCELYLKRTQDKRHRNLIEKIMELMKNSEDFEQSVDDSQSNEYEEYSKDSQKSQSAISELDLIQLEAENGKPKNKKQKRFLEEKLKTKQVIQFMEDLVIEDHSRLMCNVSTKWLDELPVRFKQN